MFRRAVASVFTESVEIKSLYGKAMGCGSLRAGVCGNTVAWCRCGVGRAVPPLSGPTLARPCHGLEAEAANRVWRPTETKGGLFRKGAKAEHRLPSLQRNRVQPPASRAAALLTREDNERVAVKASGWAWSPPSGASEIPALCHGSKAGGGLVCRTDSGLVSRFPSSCLQSSAVAGPEGAMPPCPVQTAPQSRSALRWQCLGTAVAAPNGTDDKGRFTQHAAGSVALSALSPCPPTPRSGYSTGEAL